MFNGGTFGKRIFFLGLPEFLSQTQESVKHFSKCDTHTCARTCTHTCTHLCTCFFLLAACSEVVATLPCSPYAAVFNGPVLSQCGLRPRIHPQFVCRMEACLAKQEVSVGSQPSPPSLELENASEQKQAGVVEPQGRINAKNTLIFKCLSGTW